jgi:hypothetical protein
MEGEDQSRRTVTPWPIGLATRLRYPTLILGLGSASLGALLLWWSGTYNIETPPPYWGSTGQMMSFAIAYPILLGYIIGMVPLVTARSSRHLNALRPVLAGDAAETISRLNRVDPTRLWIATGVGIVLGLANIDVVTIFGFREMPPNSVDLSLAAASMVLWVVMARFIYLLVHNAWLFSELGEHHTRVDLYRPRTLRPYAQVGILGLLAVMAALALTPLQGLDAEFRIENYSWAFAVGLPTAIALPLLAMRGIRKATLATKHAELESLDQAIAGASRDLDEDSTQRLNALLDRRAYVSEQHGWPMDLRTVSRAAFYVVIPPLAWVGAALVERAVEALIGS